MGIPVPSVLCVLKGKTMHTNPYNSEDELDMKEAEEDLKDEQNHDDERRKKQREYRWKKRVRDGKIQ